MYGHSLKGTDSVKFLGVHIDNHLCMKRHVEHIERASFISTMIITRLNSIKATLLYTDYACTAITALNKTQRQKLEVLQEEHLILAVFQTLNFVHVAILLAKNNAFLP